MQQFSFKSKMMIDIYRPIYVSQLFHTFPVPSLLPKGGKEVSPVASSYGLMRLGHMALQNMTDTT